MLWQILVSLIALWRLYVYYQKRRLIQLSKYLKNDYKAFPLIGHAYMLTGNSEERMKAVQLMGRQAIKHGGMTGTWLGGSFYVVIADPKVLEIVMKTCLEKDDTMRFLRTIIGNGTIFAPVPIWRPRRKILAPTFSPKYLNKFIEIFARQSSIMVGQLQKRAGTGSFSIWNYLTTYTMDSVCDSTLGVKLNAQLHPDQPFSKAFERYCQLTTTRIVRPWLHSNFIYSILPSYKEVMKCKMVLYNFIEGVIISHRNKISKSKELKAKESGLKTFLELLIESSGGSQGYSDMELLEETLTIVLAGTDTSAVGACFVVVMLSKYPDVQEKVYQELQEVFGDSDSSVTIEELHRLKYLDAVIRETLRLYPPVPIITRKIEKDQKLPSGVTLVEGCGVVVHIWATHRNPEYWGDDAELFRPERFMDSPPKHPAAFQPFSYGPRSCIGYQYAMMSMKTSLVALVRKYRILPDVHTNTSTDGPLRVTFDIMMKDVNRFTVQLETRSR